MVTNYAALSASQVLLTNLRDHVKILHAMQPSPAILATVEDSLNGLLRDWTTQYSTIVNDKPIVLWPFLREQRHFYVTAAQDLEGHIVFVLSSRLLNFTKGVIDDGGLLAPEREEHNQEMECLNAMTYNERLYADAVRHFIPDIGSDDLRWVCNRAARIYRALNDSCIDNFRIMRLGAPSHQSASMYDRALERGCCGFADHEVYNPLTGNSFKIGFNYGH